MSRFRDAEGAVEVASRRSFEERLHAFLTAHDTARMLFQAAQPGTIIRAILTPFAVRLLAIRADPAATLFVREGKFSLPTSGLQRSIPRGPRHSRSHRAADRRPLAAAFFFVAELAPDLRDESHIKVVLLDHVGLPREPSECDELFAWRLEVTQREFELLRGPAPSLNRRRRSRGTFHSSM